MKPHVKRGLIRLASSILLPWYAWFGFATWTANQCSDDWQSAAEIGIALANDYASRAETAPIFHEGGLDRDHYIDRYQYVQDEIKAAFIQRDACASALESNVLLLFAPVATLVAYGVFFWIRAGFRRID